MNRYKMIESKAKTYYLKNRGIPTGCKYCLEGAKAVLFLNGKCQKPTHCSWYCPISEKRKDKGDSYANEIHINSLSGLIEEINKINALGMSVTGGEPLIGSNLQKTLEYIGGVKKEKGNNFHVHLYTNGLNFTEDIALLLMNAGLDEIRFHPPEEKWENIKLALGKGMSVGAELPVIPDQDYLKYLRDFIIYLDQIGAEFINLNEFEFCFPNSHKLKDRGFKLKKNTIASVENSKESGIEIMQNMASKTDLKIHFCSIEAKDYYQLKNRYLRRAKNVKKEYEEITDEGLIIYGQITGEPRNIHEFHKFLIQQLKIPKRLISYDQEKIEMPYYIVVNDEFSTYINQFKLVANIVEKTPFKREEYYQITEIIPLNVFKEEWEAE